MDEPTWLALCVYDEARGESDDGKAAVARVVLNRTRKHFCSDGTIKGTVLAKGQFSGFWYDVVDGKYTRVCFSADAAERRAERKLEAAEQHPQTWAACNRVADAVRDGSYEGGPDYQRLTADAVLYLNPDPKLVPHLPAWANPAKLVCRIGHHSFFHA